MTRLLVILFSLIVAGAGLAIGRFMLSDSVPVLGSLHQLADPLSPVDPTDDSKQVFTVSQGATAADIGSELQRRGLVRSALVFRFAAEQAGVGSSLVAGNYELSRSMSTTEVLEVLARGEVKRGLVATIPEGWRSEQIADRLEATGVSGRDEFLRAVAEPASVPDIELIGDLPPQRLEGYLFPETYEVPQKVPGTRAAQLMLQMFNKRVGDQLRTTPTNLTTRQVIILASIVEREARQAFERPLIAGVYLNRLAEGLVLQADPTVQYAVANRDGPAAVGYNYWKPELTADDLQFDSPFNTYVYAGLPPGPICNPGLAAIKAVLQPAHTDYLYFVATTDGSGAHLFARTLGEHNANVAKVRNR